MSVGIIGGADGPTSLYIGLSPSSLLWGIVLAAAAAALIVLLVRGLKKKK